MYESWLLVSGHQSLAFGYLSSVNYYFKLLALSFQLSLPRSYCLVKCPIEVIVLAKYFYLFF